MLGVMLFYGNTMGNNKLREYRSGDINNNLQDAIHKVNYWADRVGREEYLKHADWVGAQGYRWKLFIDNE